MSNNELIEQAKDAIKTSKRLLFEFFRPQHLLFAYWPTNPIAFAAIPLLLLMQIKARVVKDGKICWLISRDMYILFLFLLTNTN